MSDDLPNDIWKDRSVQAALKEGCSPQDIACLRCPQCDRLGYYNQGSHFTCRFCQVTFYALSEDEEVPEGRPCVRADEMVNLADTVTDTTDGYHNETQ